MLGNGETAYDYGNDGEGQIIAACSVRLLSLAANLRSQSFSQANVRGTNVATKLRITYVKDMFLDVRIQLSRFISAPSLNSNLSQVKVQHRACKSIIQIDCPYSIPPWVGDDWTDCFSLSPISLPSAPYLGFSAMTGDVFDAHE